MNTGADHLDRLRQIRCLLTDVDGVLTDGKIHFTSDGREFKSFDIHDGHGISMAHRAGLVVGFISGRASAATEQRAADLGVKILMQRPTNKGEMFEEVRRQFHFLPEEICFIGDDLVDLPAMRRAGFAVAVCNAVEEVRAAAHYVTKRPGGSGAVREVIEMILKARGTWADVTARYMAASVLALVVLATATASLAEKPSNRDEAGLPVKAVGHIEKFEVPERDENGNVKWRMAGDRAQILPDGTFDVSNMRAEFFRSNEVAMVFSAPQCFLDRQSRTAKTDGPVKIESKDLILTGVGGAWSGDKSLFVVNRDVRVVFGEGVNAAGPTNAPATDRKDVEK
jgi:3-deoxy-D-manno-octulosonate 8-phosphate phosphatase (KDO 8-P phosphatase)